MNAVLQTLLQLELSFQSESDHPSMSLHRNPVLARLREGLFTAEEVGEVLGQYSLLPATIVEYLMIGATRLRDWKKVKAELERNVGEELGTRTESLSHYVILKSALSKELRLDISEARPSESTEHFLDSVRQELSKRPLAFVAGMLYGLEASAIPELTIVAEILNEYALLAGLKQPINTSAMTPRVKGSEPSGLRNNRYSLNSFSLNSFFALHLLDFEIGHKQELASALEEYIKTATDRQSFEAGFEYVLNQMDEWWNALAQYNRAEISDIRIKEEGTQETAALLN
jgi:hypothetical protein